MSTAMETLLRTLDLEAIDDGGLAFRGQSPQTARQRVFGGQVIGQALVAAQRTVASDRFVHSLHCYFMRPGDPRVAIEYRVDPMRDGGSFSTRQVVAHQHDKAIFSLSASFQRDEPGLSHAFKMPDDIPQPETLLSENQIIASMGDRVPDSIRRYWLRERPIELRPISLAHYVSDEKLPPEQNIWIRAVGDVPADRGLQAAILAYLSDMTLLDTSLFVHGRSIFNPDLQVASLDHSMWFHRPDPLNDWLLYTQDSPSTSSARGFTRGSIFNRSGEMIASVAQEGLIRVQND
ncbi:MAG: acyl-CoA thioesterase II [Pseudomonadota bacterium]